MKNTSWVRPLALALVAVVVFASGWTVIAGSPYGLWPLELWLAIAYLVAATAALLLYFAGVQPRASSPANTVTSTAAVLAAFVLAWLLAVLLPHAVVVGIYHLVGPLPIGSRALLLTKYSGHLATEAVRWHTWLLGVATLGALRWSLHRRPQINNAPQPFARVADPKGRPASAESTFSAPAGLPLVSAQLKR